MVKIWYGGKTPGTDRLRKEVGAIVADFKALGATDTDIRCRLARYKERWPTMTASARALIKNWQEFSPARADELKDAQIAAFIGA